MKKQNKLKVLWIKLFLFCFIEVIVNLIPQFLANLAINYTLKFFRFCLKP